MVFAREKKYAENKHVDSRPGFGQTASSCRRGGSLITTINQVPCPGGGCQITYIYQLPPAKWKRGAVLNVNKRAIRVYQLSALLP